MALELTLVRYPRAECCPGNLYLRNEYGDIIFRCDTLEHVTRKEKIKGRTGIPCGTYDVVFSPSRTFKQMMPYLLNVPNFTGIMIHPGNTLRDTEGCILVGKAFGTALVESRTTFNTLKELLTSKPYRLKITIKNGKEEE